MKQIIQLFLLLVLDENMDTDEFLEDYYWEEKYLTFAQENLESLKMVRT